MKPNVFRLVGFLVVLGLLIPSIPKTKASIAGARQVVNSLSNMVTNEVLFSPEAGGYEWVELKNNGSQPEAIAGYGLTDEDNHWYAIPSALPAVPAGAFVVVIFDGQGSLGDDYNFSDNRTTLHSPSGLVNIFEDGADQVSLYTQSGQNQVSIFLPVIARHSSGAHAPGAASPQPAWKSPSDQAARTSPSDPAPATGTITAFVAWGGDPGSDAQNAIAAGLWSPGDTINLFPAADVVDDSLVLVF